MDGYTVEQLLEFCKAEKKKGNGKKKILLSSDDEGNEYHQLFYGFTPTIDKKGKNFFKESLARLHSCSINVNDDKQVNEYIILG